MSALSLRQGWPLYLGMTVAGAAAVVASAATLAALADAAGWAGRTPWLLPAALDVGGAAGGWCWLRPGVPSRARRFGRVVALAGAAGTLLGNAAGHLVTTGHLSAGPVLIVIVGAVPAVVLVALAHLAALLTDRTAPAAPLAAPEQVPAVASSPAPGGSETAVPGDGGETPPAAPPRGRSTKAPAKRPGKPSRDVVLAEYVTKVIASGGTPIPADALELVRTRTGRGMRDQALREALRNLTDEASGRTAAVIPEGGGALNGRTPGGVQA